MQTQLGIPARVHAYERLGDTRLGEHAARHAEPPVEHVTAAQSDASAVDGQAEDPGNRGGRILEYAAPNHFDVKPSHRFVEKPARAALVLLAWQPPLTDELGLLVERQRWAAHHADSLPPRRLGCSASRGQRWSRCLARCPISAQTSENALAEESGDAAADAAERTQRSHFQPPCGTARHYP
jgi:hypothetical protein